MRLPALAVAVLLALPALAQPPAPPELVDIAQKLGAPPGFKRSSLKTRTGLPLLYRAGANTLAGDPALRDKAKAIFELYLADAEAGDAVARESVARLYQAGAGVARSEVIAFNWMRLAAEQGNPEALIGLSTMYLYGNGTPKNGEEAARWARRAIGTESEPSAWLILGIASITGPDKRLAEGIDAWTKAAAQGEPAALLNLANAYYAGYYGLRRDEERGAELLRRAIDIYRGSGNTQTKEAARKLLIQAEVAIREKRFDEASTRLFQALVVEPVSPMAWYNLGLLSGEQQKYGDAMYYMQGFLILAPDAPQARGAQDLIYEWQARVRK